jgi:glucosyl-3-phosphoglycerate synthase
VIAQFDWRSFSAPALVERKLATGTRISVCIPACNEQATVGDIVSVIREDLMERHSVVDELVVVDDGSSDATAKEAEAAGAGVVSLPRTCGKGEAMWQGLQSTTGDLVAYCDADIYDFTARFVLGLVGPLLAAPEVVLVKGAYRRPLDGVPGEGGRVTELVAKPLIGLLFPDLKGLRQPLAGEWASRRPVLSEVPYAGGYGVELGMLIDIAERYGPDAIAECDLGERRHRNRSLADLAPQAETIMKLALVRAGLLPPQ